MKKRETEKPVYEIRSAGITLCSSTIPLLGYPVSTIRQMQKNGLYLYVDGRRVKKPLPAGQEPETASGCITTPSE